MSRVYRIRVAESSRRILKVADGFQVKLELLGVLPKEQMKELLAAELSALGFERDGDTMRRNDDDDILLEVDLLESTVTAKRSTEEEVNIAVERERGIEEEVLQAGRERLRKSVLKEIETQIEEKQVELESESVGILDRKLRDLQSELQPASNRAIANALKIKAQQMGQIQEISENPETGEITIKVEV